MQFCNQIYTMLPMRKIERMAAQREKSYVGNALGLLEELRKIAADQAVGRRGEAGQTESPDRGEQRRGKLVGDEKQIDGLMSELRVTLSRTLFAPIRLWVSLKIAVARDCVLSFPFRAGILVRPILMRN
jgi:hypothetical protein